MFNGFTLWITGVSGVGKSTLSLLVAERLKMLGYRVEVLDGDVIRTNLSKGLGFSKEDRDTNIRRIGFVADLLSRNGVITVVSAISPYRSVRDEVRELVTKNSVFVEVYAKCPLKILIERDTKGLYKKAMSGEIKNFTGVSDPYEAPINPEITVDSSVETENDSVSNIMNKLYDMGLI